jgi:phospholipid/cholesterol/gamma-HCH transport system substrate-binding protein
MADEGDKRAQEDEGRRSLTGFAQVLLPRSLGIKVGMLLAFTIMLIGGFIVYVLYERGTFEQTQRLRLVTDNAEGIGVGSHLTFAGFPIGRVRRIVLRDDGKVQINVRVPVSEAKWLRESSIFVIDVPLVGAAKLRAITANLQDAPLPDRAERPVLRGDTAQEIPRLVANLRSVLENLEEMTKSGGSLQASLANVRTATERLAGKSGALGAVLGSDEEAQKVMAAIDRANALLGSLGGVTKRLDDVLAKTDRRVFGEGGVMDGTERAVTQVNAILGQVHDNLKKVDQILADAQATAANTRAATTDLGALRAEVDASLRKVGGLIDEINRKWPFERKTDVRLP